jgi:hypothetical protein
MKIDSGAALNVMSLEEFKKKKTKYSESLLKPTNMRLILYGGKAIIVPIAQVTLNISCRG